MSLGFDPNRIQTPTGYFAGGQIRRSSGPKIDVTRPSDGQSYADIPDCTQDEVDEVIEAAWRAARETNWRTCPPRQRAKILRRWAEVIEADGPILGPLEAVGSTRPIRDVVNFDIPFTSEGIRFFAELADKAGGEVAPTRHESLGLTIPEPYGVVAAISPWNFPLIMASWKFAPALAAGNAVVLKPSELTPLSALRLAELAITAGMPPNIFNVVQGRGPTVGQALCRHPKVAKITFTGSTASGQSVMAAAIEAGVKPVTLELGGKSPQIVFADAPDVKRTAATIARGISGNAGQVCVAGSRLIAHERVADNLVNEIAEIFNALIPGPTWTEIATLSPLISEKHMERVDSIVQRTVRSGAEIQMGGARAPAPQDGAYYLPTILSRVTGEMAAIREEIFGPVLTVQTFKDEEEALSLADHPVYGLAAAVHTADITKALRAVRKLEAGTVWVNRYGRSSDFVLPTGGYKRSGIGKDLGRAAYEANLRMKTVLIDLD